MPSPTSLCTGQYHTARPYIRVTSIPNFDPTQLPYWDIYVKEGTADTIKIGGTMAGEFTAGLSGGQRKLLFFELIRQRTAASQDLLIVLDEPFAGVTDDFVPFIKERLEEMRQKHNIVLVTNDHVEVLTEMSDNTITVSAIDRSVVKINQREGVDRTKAIHALGVGKNYRRKAGRDELNFFYQVEVAGNAALMQIVYFNVFCFALFLATFWDSAEEAAALVLVAGGIIGFFGINPALLSLVEWRNAMEEEAEALMHSSKETNRLLKTCLMLLLILIISLAEFGVVNAVIDGLSSVKFWVAMLMDSASMTFPLICLGLYTTMPFQAVQILGSLPFLLMIFLSTTFSPGAGVKVVKELRYLFSRFYFWCMIPGVQDDMENCPDEDLNILYLILSGFIGVVLFLVVKTFNSFSNKRHSLEEAGKLADMLDDEFQDLQVELYGEKGLRHFKHLQSTLSNVSTHSRGSNGSKSGKADNV